MTPGQPTPGKRWLSEGTISVGQGEADTVKCAVYFVQRVDDVGMDAVIAEAGRLA